MCRDFRLIAIPSPDLLGDRDLIDACRAAEAGGATAVQLRLKGSTAAELLRATERAVAALRVPVFVNDRVDVATAARAAGVHLGADDLPPHTIRTVAARPMMVGVSVGSPREAAEARAADADYWSLGPFFATGSKTDAGTALGASGFRGLARAAPPGMPLVAIGGIRAERIEEVVAAGAVGVAVIGAIFAEADIESATRRLRRALDAMR